MQRPVLYYLAPIIKIILFLFFIVLWVIPVAMVFGFSFLPLAGSGFAIELYWELGMVLAILGSLQMVFFIFKIDFWTVFVRKIGAFSGFLKGTLIGFLLIAFCGGILWANGNVRFAMGSISFITLAVYLFYFILVAVFEELMFRTYPLFVLAESYRIAVAIIINSIGFGLVHLANPGYTPLAFLNIVLAGTLFAVFTLIKRNVSWAIGIHFGWNFAQGVLLGYKVSGLATERALIAQPIGKAYLSGGDFGIEGSVFCTLILSILISWMLYRYRISPVVTWAFEEVHEEKERIA